MCFRYRPCLARLAATAAILVANPACDEPTRRTPDGGAVTARAGVEMNVAPVPQPRSSAGTGSSAPSAPVSASAGAAAPTTMQERGPASTAGTHADAGGPETSEDAGIDEREPPPQPDSGLAPFETHGEPLTGARANAWTYIEFPDTQCRDGSPAGLFLNLGTANKLMIFLEGGGRCADEQTCLTLNSANIPAGEIIRGVAMAGVLDRTHADNPVRDWNFVYVPYCTGDRHGGDNPDGNVPNVGAQKFTGYTNMKKFLDRIVPTFRTATNVLVTGISAGGFGAAYTSVLIQRAFSRLKIKLIIDSGPFVSASVFTACDQEHTRKLYAAERTFLGECGAACPNPNDYWMDYGMFLAKTFADRPTGLISSTEDLVERAFFGIGANDCTAALDLLNPAISAATFRGDILAYRSRLADFPNASTFYPDTTTHTFIAFEEFYSTRAGGVRLVDWFAKIANGESPGHAGP